LQGCRTVTSSKAVVKIALRMNLTFWMVAAIALPTGDPASS
jgi:hypothetical protein